MKKQFLTLTLIAAFVTPMVWAQVVVKIGPPPAAIVERPPASPGPRYIWVGGYYRWNGARYIWVPGHYVIPPTTGAIWIAPAWIERDGTWVFAAGYWR
jgi:hypothetical protein